MPLSMFVTLPKNTSSDGQASTGFRSFCFFSPPSSSCWSFCRASMRRVLDSDFSFLAFFASLLGTVDSKPRRMAAISSKGSWRFITRPISSKLRSRPSTSFSYEECINRENATFMGGSKRLVRPKSSRTGTEASPSSAPASRVDTSTFPMCGSALKAPPTCICTAQAAHTRARSRSRSTPYRSSAAVSRTGNPAQKSITSTASVASAVRGTIARTPCASRSVRTSSMFTASCRKSSSFRTSALYSAATAPKSNSGSK
mmetsp:Transcript_10563/g.21087  ORF Transcript_10563/g.21087 Transcript_10563/m.21087 type:complete len:257 (-) Transcript_10563:942-1712(-)